MDDRCAQPAATGRLKKRAEFLAVAKGRRFHGPLFTVQARAGDASRAPRVGLTLTKKVGNAVVRNRIRRRLREALRVTQGLPTEAGWDYVLIGRREALAASFVTIRAELARALGKVKASGKGERRTTRQAADHE